MLRLSKRIRLARAAALIAAAALPSFAAGQGLRPHQGITVVKAARVITVSGEEFAPGEIVIEDGVITAVGTGIEYPPYAKVIRASGETVMPGLVHPRTRYELPSYRRNGVNGDQSAGNDVYISELDLSDFIENGFTTVVFLPDGEDIPGTAKAYRTAQPDDEEDQAHEAGAYLRVAPDWDSGGKFMLHEALKKAQAEIDKVEEARKKWEEEQKKKAEEAAKEKPEENGEGEGGPGDGGKRYQPDEPPAPKPEGGEGDEKKEGEGEKKEEVFEPPPIDPKYQPLVDLIQEKEGARMVVEVLGASAVLHLIDVLEAFDDPAHSMYLLSSRYSDYAYVAEKLGERESHVIIRPLINYEPYTTKRINLAAQLTKAGAKVALTPRWDNREALVQYRSHVAELVRMGLSREDAIAAMTLRAAEAIGLGGSIGSIEEKKEANLVFLSGDPVDPHTEVNRVMVQGEMVWTADDDR